MEPTRLLAFVLGFGVVGLVLWDVFQTVVVPRPTPGVYRISRWIVRGAWRLVRGIASRKRRSAQDPLLGMFGPGVAMLLLLAWLGSLIVGYGLILYGLGDQIRPPVNDVFTGMFFAAESLLTIGYGEIIATGFASRIVVTLAAISGLGIVAIVVTFLFSLYASYQRREREVIALQAVAGAPPSAVKLLSAYGKLGLVDRLPDFFITWQRWEAEVLDSHVAYPLLGYFRASHDNLSWISALGTVLDAASLVATTIKGVPRGEAELCRRVGAHLVEDISSLGFRHGAATPLSREEWDVACRRLQAAGYELEPADRAWRLFEAARAAYAPQLQQMADYWATPAASWLGTHAPLRSAVHRDAEVAPDAAVENVAEAKAP
jgi:ion channel